MNIIYPYVEGTSEKQQRKLRSQKIRSTYYTENTLHKLLCNPKDRVSTKDKNKVAHEIDCSKWKAVYIGESNRSLKPQLDEY